MGNMEKHLRLLGLKARDRVTGMEGVVSSVCFDLYGCVQATINPGLDRDGKPRDQYWFDIARLLPISDEPVMVQPDFIQGRQAEGKQGPAERPAQSKN